MGMEEKQGRVALLLSDVGEGGFGAGVAVEVLAIDPGCSDGAFEAFEEAISSAQEKIGVAKANREAYRTAKAGAEAAFPPWKYGEEKETTKARQGAVGEATQEYSYDTWEHCWVEILRPGEVR